VAEGGRSVWAYVAGLCDNDQEEEEEEEEEVLLTNNE